MSGRSRNRPRRGDENSNVLVEGDTGIFPGPLGGAAPGASESGDLASREFGVPQADIPGGRRHLVNPQTKPAKPVVKPERPADYHKEHGVEPLDDGQYETPPDATEEKPARPAPAPKYHNAVPVYLVDGPESGGNPLNVIGPDKITVPAAGGRPVRVCNKDDRRSGVRLLNEDSAAKIRISNSEAGLEGAAGQIGGPLIPPGATSYLPLQTQDELYAIVDGASTAILSVIIETELRGPG